MAWKNFRGCSPGLGVLIVELVVVVALVPVVAEGGLLVVSPPAAAEGETEALN